MYTAIHFFSKLSISWIVSWNYAYKHEQYIRIPLLVRNLKKKWWYKFNDEKYDLKYLDDAWIKLLHNSFKPNRLPAYCRLKPKQKRL